jgi:hypothetical protein
MEHPQNNGTETPTNIPKKIAKVFTVLVFASKENI